MFLETKRDGETTTKPDIYALETLIAWLEKMPAEMEYCYLSNRACLVAQYLQAKGFGRVGVDSCGFYHEGVRTPLPSIFNVIALNRPPTFGAARARARELAAHAEADSRADRRG